MPATRIYAPMSEFSTAASSASDIPSGIKILTMLTFIGCGINLLLCIFTPYINNFLLDLMNKGAANPDTTATQLAEIEQGRVAIELANANMVPLMVIGIAGLLLCLAGAIMMRKLKSDGYWLYLAGELLPVIASFILLGTSQFTGIVSVIIGVGIPLLFVSLYSLQKKFLSR